MTTQGWIHDLLTFATQSWNAGTTPALESEQPPASIDEANQMDTPTILSQTRIEECIEEAEPEPAVAERVTPPLSFPEDEHMGMPTFLGIAQSVAETNPAVAEETAVAEEPAVEATDFRVITRDRIRSWVSETDTPCPTIPGDSIATDSAPMSDESDNAFEARHAERRSPASTYDGEIEHTPHKSSKWNAEPEVGNIGIFCGNWGKRKTLEGSQEQRDRRHQMD